MFVFKKLRQNPTRNVNEAQKTNALSKSVATNETGSLTYLPVPSSSQPNFSRALRATSGLGALVGGNLSRQ